jgi:malate dehydrogenase (quinone)
VPTEVDPSDWELIHRRPARAGDEEGPRPRAACSSFGTELVAAADGSLADSARCASPGASTATPIMFEPAQEPASPRQYAGWEKSFKDMIPSLGRDLADDETLLKELSEYTARTLQLI